MAAGARLGDGIGEEQPVVATIRDASGRFDSALPIGLTLVVCVLVAVCVYLAYTAGYFGTGEGGRGTWQQQYERMKESRDDLESLYNSTLANLEAMTAERDEYRGKWESDRWDVYGTGIPPTYVVFLDGGICKAMNVQTGRTQFEDSDAVRAIQAAVDALPTTGGKILLQNGTYTLTKHLTDGGKNNVILQGEGRDTILKMQDNTQETVIDISGRTGWIIIDLSIDGNKAGNVQVPGGVPNDMNQNGIHFFKVTDSKVIRCYVHDTVFHGINIHYQSTDNQVINCLVEECGTAGDYGASSGILIFSNSPRNLVRGCRLTNNYARGIYISANSTDCNISENMITGGWSEGASGILVMGHSDRVRLSHNTIYDVPGNGIDVGNRYGPEYRDITISSNTIVNAGYDGIWCGSEGDGVIVENNNVKWSRYYGISVRAASGRIECNHIFTETNMTIFAGTSGLQIAGNWVHR